MNFLLYILHASTKRINKVDINSLTKIFSAYKFIEDLALKHLIHSTVCRQESQASTLLNIPVFVKIK